MDTRFSSAIHMLILLSNAQVPLTSEQIAKSVGTNASYIRKISALLKKAGIISSSQGSCGCRLLIEPDALTLFMIYQAITESEEVHVFDIHQNPDDQCSVGKHIRPVLSIVFQDISDKAQQELQRWTLADCTEEIRKAIFDQ